MSLKYTTFWHLIKPDYDCEKWHLHLNENLDTIDRLIWNLYGFNVVYCKTDSSVQTSVPSYLLSKTFQEGDKNFIQAMANFGDSRVGLINGTFTIDSLTLNGTSLFLFGCDSDGNISSPSTLKVTGDIVLRDNAVLIVQNLNLEANSIDSQSSTLYFLHKSYINVANGIFMSDRSYCRVLGNPVEFVSDGDNVFSLKNSSLMSSYKSNWKVSSSKTGSAQIPYPYAQICLTDNSAVVLVGTLRADGDADCIFSVANSSTCVLRSLKLSHTGQKDLCVVQDAGFYILGAVEPSENSFYINIENHPKLKFGGSIVGENSEVLLKAIDFVGIPSNTTVVSATNSSVALDNIGNTSNWKVRAKNCTINIGAIYPNTLQVDADNSLILTAPGVSVSGSNNLLVRAE